MEWPPGSGFSQMIALIFELWRSTRRKVRFNNSVAEILLPRIASADSTAVAKAGLSRFIFIRCKAPARHHLFRCPVCWGCPGPAVFAKLVGSRSGAVLEGQA